MKRIDSSKYDTDKGPYTATYERIFEPLAEQEIKLLELGVLRGGSLRLWRDYFINGQIVGLDLNPVQITDSDRIRLYRGSQDDLALLHTIGKENAPQGFDIIIDDASHIGELTRTSFWFLFNNSLKPGGIYVIEDWGTGYWPSWPDGKLYNKKSESYWKTNFWKTISSFVESESAMFNRVKVLETINRKLSNRAERYSIKREFDSHNTGMVGFVKQLVDECAFAALSKKERGLPPFRVSKFEKMELYLCQAIIYKAAV